jgi:hypothetical protein
MNTTLANTSSLYMNDNGRICCVNHAGRYMQAEYTHKPESNSYRTPLGTWEKVASDFILMWVDEFGTAPKCDGC